MQARRVRKQTVPKPHSGWESRKGCTEFQREGEVYACLGEKKGYRYVKGTTQKVFSLRTTQKEQRWKTFRQSYFQEVFWRMELGVG